MVKLVIKVLVNQLSQFSTGLRDVKDEALVLRRIVLIGLVRLSVSWLYLLLYLGVDDVDVWQFERHHGSVEELGSYLRVVAEVNVEQLLEVSEHRMEFRRKGTHKHFLPKDKHDWLSGCL